MSPIEKKYPALTGLTWHHHHYYSFFIPVDWHLSRPYHHAKGVQIPPALPLL